MPCPACRRVRTVDDRRCGTLTAARRRPPLEGSSHAGHTHTGHHSCGPRHGLGPGHLSPAHHGLGPGYSSPAHHRRGAPHHRGPRTADLDLRPRRGDGRVGAAGRDRAAGAGHRRARSGEAAPRRRPHDARGRRHQRGTRDPRCPGHVAAARRGHAPGELRPGRPAHRRDRHGRRCARHRGPRPLRDAVRPRGGWSHLAAVLRRPHVAAHSVLRRLHGAGDPEDPGPARGAGGRPNPRARLHHEGAHERRRGRVRRLRVPRAHRRAVPRVRGRRDPGLRRAQPHLAQDVVAPEREHGRLVPPRLRGRRSDPRRGARPVPPLRHPRAGGGRRHPRVRGGPRRGRHPPQRPGRALHGALRPGPHGAVHPRPGRTGVVHGDQGGEGHPERRRLAGRVPPAAGADHGASPPRLPDAHGAADARHHAGAHRDRAHRPLFDGRRVGAAGGPQHGRARPLRDRRGRLRPARCEPVGRQLAHRAAGVRSDHR